MQKVYFKEIDKIIKNLLSSSEFEIKIAVAWITDTQILNVLEKCLDRGVSVNIIFYKDRINKIDLFESLHRKGANINYTTSLMHNKFCVIDKRIVINGSYNWTHSAKSNSENIQVTESVDISDLFLQEFNEIEKKAINTYKYFADNEESFNRYLMSSIGLPKKYPVFYKQDLNDLLIKKIFSQKYTDKICPPIYYPANHLKYYYILFYDEQQYLKHHRSVYQFLYTTKKDTIINGESIRTNPSLTVIDILKAEDIITINNLKVDNYIDNNIRFCQEQFIYLEDIKKDNILFISFYHSIFTKDDKRNNIHITLLKNDVNNYAITCRLTFEILNYNPIQNKLEVITHFETNTLEDKTKYRSSKFINVQNFSYNKEEDKQEIVEKINFYLQKILRKRERDIQEAEEKRLRQLQYEKELEEFKKRATEQAKRLREENKHNPNNQNCYIATMVYNDINHPNVERLRNFRDEVLLLNNYGKAFVKYYYKISPWVVEKFGKYKLLHMVAKFIIEKIILKYIKSNIN